MDTKFTITFFIVTLILEIIPIRRVMEQTSVYRRTDFSDIDDTVTAHLIESGTSYDDDNRNSYYWGRYEWYYNGKRRRTTLTDSNDSFPYELQLTVNRKTGRYKTPEGERRIRKMEIGLVMGAFVLGYNIASLICGYSPLFS